MSLVTIAAFDKTPEAQLAKNLLDAEGITAFLDGEVTSDILHLGSEVKLQVDEADADRAREVLDGAERHELTATAAQEAEIAARETGTAPA